MEIAKMLPTIGIVQDVANGTLLTAFWMQGAIMKGFIKFA